MSSTLSRSCRGDLTNTCYRGTCTNCDGDQGPCTDDPCWRADNFTGYCTINNSDGLIKLDTACEEQWWTNRTASIDGCAILCAAQASQVRALIGAFLTQRFLDLVQLCVWVWPPSYLVHALFLGLQDTFVLACMGTAVPKLWSLVVCLYLSMAAQFVLTIVATVYRWRWGAIEDAWIEKYQKGITQRIELGRSGVLLAGIAVSGWQLHLSEDGVASALRAAYVMDWAQLGPSVLLCNLFAAMLIAFALSGTCKRNNNRNTGTAFEMLDAA